MPQSREDRSPGPGFGRITVLPTIFLTWILWAVSIGPVRYAVDRRVTEPLDVPLTLLGLYGAALLVLYALVRTAIWFRVRHLEGLGQVKVFGFDLRSLYYRPGLTAIDFVGLVIAICLTAASILWPPLWNLAPCAGLGVIAFLAGLFLGSATVWPMRRRKSA